MPTCQHAHMPTCQHAHMPTCPYANMPTNQGRVSWALSGSSYLWINSLCCITITTRKLFSMLQYHYVHAQVFDCLAGGCTSVWCQCPPTEQLHSSLPGCSWRGSHNQGTVRGSSILWLLPGEINQYTVVGSTELQEQIGSMDFSGTESISVTATCTYISRSEEDSYLRHLTYG